VPKIVDQHRRREEIASLTVDVIGAVGIESATIREIGQRGGLSMGVLTHYFKSKDDLLVFTFRWVADRFFTELDRLLAAAPPGCRRLEIALEAIFPKPGEHAGVGLWASLWDRALRNPVFAREHRAYYARWRRRIRTCLREAVRLKQAPANLRVADVTDLLVAAVDGLWIGSALEPKRIARPRRRAIVRQLAQAIVRPTRRGRNY
jgi:AcrR family transcriptional regulator